MGLDDGRLHDRGPGRAEPDAAVRAGPRVQGRGTAVSRKAVSYQWHLRRLMAEAGMFATTDMGPLLAARGITLSREQVYRLVTGVPERLSLPVLAALCDILDCGPGDLIEPVRRPSRKEEPPRPRSRRSGPGRCGRGLSPGPAPGDSALPGRPRASRRRPAGAGLPAVPAGHADPARHGGGRDADRAHGRGRGRRGGHDPGRAAGAGLGAGRRSWHAPARRAPGGRAAGRRAHRPRVGPRGARLRPVRPGRQAAVPDTGRGHVQGMHRPRPHGRLR